MGTPAPEPKLTQKIVGEAFVTWFNNLEFKNDKEMIDALVEIKSECKIRIDSMGIEVPYDENKAEAEGSAP